MAINLVTKFLPYVDEIFTTESKKQVLTNNDFDWAGAKTVKIYKVSTASMNDYNRNPDTSQGAFVGSRYGVVKDLDATTETMTLTKDRSFTFAIDKMDGDETATALASAKALARQQREKVIPEIDTYVLGKMVAGAGNTVNTAISKTNVYEEILKGTNELDNAEVIETGRILVVTPDTWLKMKQNSDILLSSDVRDDVIENGVIAKLDGMDVMKVPANRLPDGFQFMICHPCATVAPTKLEEYKIHVDPPGISGDLVEGRIVYDAFVLDNKASAIYVSKV